jgi:predicted ATP-dependent endonuclease of OLD family
LNPVNVFFGKNNVGKSNILRGLHLAFFCLKSDRIFLPDTMFCNRNIYKPIEIIVDLKLEEDFFDTAKVVNALREGIENIRSLIADEEEIFENSIKEVEGFIAKSGSFKPLNNLRLRIYLDYNEETSNVEVSIEDLESDYLFDYGQYKILHEQLESIIEKKISEERERDIEYFESQLTHLGLDLEEIYPFHFKYRLNKEDLMRFKRRIVKYIKEPGERDEFLFLLDNYVERFQEQKGGLIEPFSKTFNVVKGYFDKICDNFILIPNKEYFPKGPLVKKEQNGKQIEILNLNRFMDKLLSLIESPSKKERPLIQNFNSIWSRSYGDLGELEIRKFREEVFAIFDTGFTSLPIENQGLGVQDLFLYIAHMILFDSAIIAIEEPEGGLSTENQRALHNIIEDVYAGSDKQIFISSHSKEFETPNSYIIEMSKEGTNEISRRGAERDYEEKIEGILINRRLEQEKEQYAVLLREVTEREITLDILNIMKK